jgi:hypothetical protein
VTWRLHISYYRMVGWRVALDYDVVNTLIFGIYATWFFSVSVLVISSMSGELFGETLLSKLIADMLAK